jgi:hypothetical protein
MWIGVPFLTLLIVAGIIVDRLLFKRIMTRLDRIDGWFDHFESHSNTANTVGR